MGARYLNQNPTEQTTVRFSVEEKAAIKEIVAKLKTNRQSWIRGLVVEELRRRGFLELKKKPEDFI